jgi:hypothetical protein
MKVDVTSIYNLLPAIYRIRDAELGEPLKAFLSVIAEQVALLDENLAQSYDDLFIETCAPWVVPYIGDLIGYRTIKGIPTKISSPRAEVANTIGYRRRKGTASVLEQLARDVTGWDARVVEFFQRLATTQYMNHLRSGNLYAPNLRQWEPLERLDTAFETTAHTLEVRRIASGRGKYNIPNIGMFLWRLHAYSLMDSPAARLDDTRYFFSPLGNNTPLFNSPVTETEITHLATPQNVPMPLSRRVLDAYLVAYYGKESGKSVFIKADDADIDSSEIVVCNLSDIAGNKWAHTPPKNGKVAIDPVLGRIAFADAPSEPPLVTFHYGFSADMSGGEYDRGETFEDEVKPVVEVAAPDKIQDALDGLSDTGAVEVADNTRYDENLTIDAGSAGKIELRAANRKRPHLALASALQITGGADAQVTLNGFLISGNAIQVSGKLGKLRLVHCALIPGWTLDVDGTPLQPTEPSLIVDSSGTIVEIDHCILGGIRTDESARVVISSSIVDAMDETNVAFAAVNEKDAGGVLRIDNSARTDCVAKDSQSCPSGSTIIGKVHTREIELASNAIFLAQLTKNDKWLAPIWSERQQEGCVRFSYVPPQSITPRHFRCQPDLARQAIDDKLRADAKQLSPPPSLATLDAEIQAAKDSETLRVKPQFTSLRYGDPGYGQLSQRCAVEIRAGGDNESEMGAFNELMQPQRETDLRVRLDEYLRFGLEAGIFYAT